ncbi:MAG: IS1096 element passenger TnpR family protein [Alphaproteobacteria bacterium]
MREPSDFDVTLTVIRALNLKVKDTFNYWFDFGDDWWHEIKIASIADKAPKPEKAYPRITSRTGDSPPQYPDWDEDE